MEVIFNKKQTFKTNKEIYTCHTCKKLFNWGKNSSWFGSYKMMENNPEKIKNFCSDKCASIIK